MEYFAYGRDRPGTFPLKVRLAEEHWSYMDRFADRMIARGPTLTSDGAESTGSLHILDLPDAETARAFVYEEPYYRAGVFESVLLCRFRDLLGRTMWDFSGTGEDRFLVIADGEAAVPMTTPHLIAYGELRDLADLAPTGRAALLEAPSPAAAAETLGTTGEILPWRFGGRPAKD